MLVRLYPYARRLRLFSVWSAGQMVGAALSVYYFVTHVLPLKKTGMLSGDYGTYLRKSMYRAAEPNIVAFAGSQTLRVFTYLLSHGFFGTLALLAFLIGVFLLLRNKVSLNEAGPTPRQLALLLGLPFLVNYAAAIVRQYPYGAVRQAAFLAPFAVTGLAIGLSVWRPARFWTKSLIIAIALVFCNLFPSPGPLIRPKNQVRAQMQNAVDALWQSAPPGTTIVAAYQSALLLGYYGCGHGVVEVFPPFHEFAEAQCHGYRVISTAPSEWKFYANTLPGDLSAIAKTFKLASGSKIWLFEAGWISDSAPALIRNGAAGCTSTRTFGDDIFICELMVGGDESKTQLNTEPQQ
jgi:hypothetical protein